MSYTPNNVSIYQAAFCGAQAGIGASGFLVDPNSADYASITQTAGQWAQAMDTVWGATVPDALVLQSLSQISIAMFSARAIRPSPSISSYFTSIARAVKGLLQNGSAYFSGQGIIPAGERGYILNAIGVATQYPIAVGQASTGPLGSPSGLGGFIPWQIPPVTLNAGTSPLTLGFTGNVWQLSCACETTDAGLHVTFPDPAIGALVVEIYDDQNNATVNPVTVTPNGSSVEVPGSPGTFTAMPFTMTSSSFYAKWYATLSGDWKCVTFYH